MHNSITGAPAPKKPDLHYVDKEVIESYLKESFKVYASSDEFATQGKVHREHDVYAHHVLVDFFANHFTPQPYGVGTEQGTKAIDAGKEVQNA